MEELKINNLLDILAADHRRQDPPARIFIGSGCSITAGIPSAPGIIDRIKREYPSFYEKACDGSNLGPTYSECMENLIATDRNRMMEAIIRDAKLNHAHLAIACLLEARYFDRVLTTNFDPLVSRACALINTFPSVYDMVASQSFRYGHITGESIFHLHGQVGGLELLHVEDGILKHTEKILPAVKDSLRGRKVIVVGYSGESDPLFPMLADTDCFRDSMIFWVTYKDNKPPLNIKDALAKKGVSAYTINGPDADSFFVKLASDLGVYPPQIIGKPFSHLKETLQQIRTIESSKPMESPLFRDVDDITHPLIDRAISEIEEPYEPLFRGMHLLDISLSTSAQTKEQYIDKALNAFKRAEEKNNNATYFASAYGDALREKATLCVTPEEKKTQLLQSENYLIAFANERQKDISAHINIARTQFELAQVLSEMKEHTSSVKKLKAAYQNIEKALEIDHNIEATHCMAGSILIALAEALSGEEAILTCDRAIVHCQLALEIDPEHYHSYVDWGLAQSIKAENSSGTAKQSYYRSAVKQYTTLIEEYPETTVGHYLRGLTLSDYANSVKSKPNRESKLQAAEQDLHVAVSSGFLSTSNLLTATDFLSQRAFEQRSAEKLQTTINFMKDVAQNEPNLERVHCELGTIYTRLAYLLPDEHKKDAIFSAIRHAITALKVNPEHWHSYYEIGMAFLELANNSNISNKARAYRLAIRHLKDYDRHVSGDWHVLYLIGLTQLDYIEYIEEGQHEEHLKLAQKYLNAAYEAAETEESKIAIEKNKPFVNTHSNNHW